MSPVTAITIFFPNVDAQKRDTRPVRNGELLEGAARSVAIALVIES